MRTYIRGKEMDGASMGGESVPHDLIEGTLATREYDVPYTRLRSWWSRGRITRYVRGDGRVFVSRAAIERMLLIEPDGPVEHIGPPERDGPSERG